MGLGSRAPACPDPPSVKRKAALKMDGLEGQCVWESPVPGLLTPFRGNPNVKGPES